MEQTAATEKLGNCYQSALHAIAGTTDPRVTLVHGRPTLTRPPFTKYGHAWIEIGADMVFDSERELFVPRERYYRAGKIDPAECHRYTRRAAAEWVDLYGHYGPWEGPEVMR